MSNNKHRIKGIINGAAFAAVLSLYVFVEAAFMPQGLAVAQQQESLGVGWRQETGRRQKAVPKHEVGWRQETGRRQKAVPEHEVGWGQETGRRQKAVPEHEVGWRQESGRRQETGRRQESGRRQGDGRRPVIGIAWVSDSTGVNANNYLDSTIAILGGCPVRLAQVVPGEAWKADSLGMVALECAERIRKEGYEPSNAASVMEGIDAVIFPGGGDISNTLYAKYVAPLVNEGFDPSRDISDYLLMDYCIRDQVPILCICRGEQMLGIYSGATLIQDIPLYCQVTGLINANTHRMPADAPQRNYARHDVCITDTSSLIHGIVLNDSIRKAPSWHHQAIGDVQGTPLKVTAEFTDSTGLCIVEAVERTDVPYAIGIQFHPEYVCRRFLIDGAEEDPCDFKSCLGIFKSLIMQAKSMQAKSMQAKSVQAKSVQARSMQAKSMQAKSMQARSMQAKSAQAKSMQAK